MTGYDAVKLAEAAHILGCSQAAVRRRVLTGLLPRGPRGQRETFSRAEIEELALGFYDWRKHLHDDGSYWLTGQRAADVLKFNRARLNQLADHGICTVRDSPRWRPSLQAGAA